MNYLASDEGQKEVLNIDKPPALPKFQPDYLRGVKFFPLTGRCPTVMKSTTKFIERFFGRATREAAGTTLLDLGPREKNPNNEAPRFPIFVSLIRRAASVDTISQTLTIAELATYRGADREAMLYAGAKTEGKIIWYTSLAGDSYKELVKAFETKYPGVKVESYRAAGAELVVRLEEEAKARRNIADTIETTEGSLIFLRDEKLLRPYDSPHLDKFPEDGKERADKGLVYWALARESYIGLLTTRSLCPRTLCRKISMAFSPATQRKNRHQYRPDERQDYRRHAQDQRRGIRQKLKAQEIKLYSIDAPALVNNIAAGEIVGSPAIFQTHTLLAASKGAPVEWVPMDLVPTNVGSAAIAAIRRILTPRCSWRIFF